MISLSALEKGRKPVKCTNMLRRVVDEAEMSCQAVFAHAKLTVEVALLHMAALACCGIEDMASMFRGVGRLEFISSNPNNGVSLQDLRCTDAN